MSRSYRKTPCIKDGGRKKHEDKKKASRRFRHCAKNKIRARKYDELPLKSTELTCSWDICDWKFWETEAERKQWIESEYKKIIRQYHTWQDLRYQLRRFRDKHCRWFSLTGWKKQYYWK